ncbi:MAG TPA: DUF819 family protein [Longimicrobiales bacterium]|nr:DUF819 family protein [Longimicrobiales bacterium]
MITSPLALSALVVTVAALSFLLDRHVRVLSRVGAGMIAILIAALLSNAGVVPIESPIYDVVLGPVTSLAIAWLLLSVNLGDLRKVGGKVLVAFGLAAVGTALGAFAGAAMFGGSFGEDTWKLAATLTGTYTGGGLNFVAVGRGTGLPDQLFAGATAADNVTTALWLGATLLLPIWLARFYPPAPADAHASAATVGAGPAAAAMASGAASVDARGASADERSAAGSAMVERQETGGSMHADHPFFTGVSISTLDLAVLAAAGLLLLLVADAVAAVVPAIPSVLWLTTFALIAGHFTPLGRVNGAFQLGNLALVLFFVIIGIFSRISEILAVGIAVFWFTLVVVGVHGVFVFGVGRLLRIDVASLAVASQAAVGGPSSALAVAVAREWRALVLPGVIVGLLGYAVGNYLGFAVGAIVRSFGAG